MNKRQRERKAARDESKRWAMVVSSLNKQAISIPLTKEVVQEVAQTAHDLGLLQVGLIALQALRAEDFADQVVELGRDCDRLEVDKNALQATVDRLRAELGVQQNARRRLRSKKARAFRREKKNARPSAYAGA